MTQAWDFVDASVLWGTRSSFLNVRIETIDFGGVYTPRIRTACSTYYDPLRYVSRPLVTVADLVSVSETEWLRMPNVGHRTIAAMKQVLAKHGIDLRAR